MQVKYKNIKKNRYPWFFVDFIEEIIPKKSVVGYKNFSCNESFFSLYTIDTLSVPNFILAEALEQVFLMSFMIMPENEGVITSTISSNVDFVRCVVVGEQIKINAELDYYNLGLAKGRAIACVKDEVVCRAEFMIALPNVMNAFSPKL